MYTIKFSKNLKTAKLPKQDYLKIREKIILLAENPRPRWAEKLKCEDSYRIAVGTYRVLYSIDDETKEVFIHDVGHRKDIYK